jgi:hypothetical protein
MQPDPTHENTFKDFQELMKGRYPRLRESDKDCDLVSQRTNNGWRYWSVFSSQVELASSTMKALQKIPDGNQDPYEKILRTPSVLMMFGVELLMISVILLAAKALSREVWITCTVVVAACMCGPLASLYNHSCFSAHCFIMWLNKPSPVFYMEGRDSGNQFYACKDRPGPSSV